MIDMGGESSVHGDAIPAAAVPRLRVLQVISSTSALDGGSATAIWNTMEALRRADVEADLVSTNEHGAHQTHSASTGDFIIDKGYRVRYFRSLKDRYASSPGLALWLMANMQSYDVIHVHGIFRFAPDVAAKIARLKRVPYILTLHNTFGSWGMTRRRPLLKRILLRSTHCGIPAHAALIHFVSKSEMEQSTKRIQRTGRPVVLPLGLELSPSELRPIEKSHSWMDAVSNSEVVLFMSRIHEIKGLDVLITAFAEIVKRRPSAQLLIAGTGPDRLVGELQDLARDVGVASRTHWLGFITGNLKRCLLSIANVLVLPSHSENFGLVVIEALLAEVPVVTTTNVPSGDFVQRFGGGLVCNLSVEELQATICNVLRHFDSFKDRTMIGLDAIKEELSLATYGAKLRDIYRGATRVGAGAECSDDRTTAAVSRK